MAILPGVLNGVNVWPVTYLMAQAVEGSATLFFFIVGGAVCRGAHLARARYAFRRHSRCAADRRIGRLAVQTDGHRVRRMRAARRHDTDRHLDAGARRLLPLRNMAVHRRILFHHISADSRLAMFAMFVQTLVSNKFMGHGIVIGVFVHAEQSCSASAGRIPFIPGAVPAYTYSDMNGYGHFVPSSCGPSTYWFAIFALLGVISMAMRAAARRTRCARAPLGRARMPAYRRRRRLALLLAVGAGGWYLLQRSRAERIRHCGRPSPSVAPTMKSNSKNTRIWMQPKLTAVDTVINIYPAQRSFCGTGRFTLQNKSSQPI